MEIKLNRKNTLRCLETCAVISSNNKVSIKYLEEEKKIYLKSKSNKGIIETSIYTDLKVKSFSFSTQLNRLITIFSLLDAEELILKIELGFVSIKHGKSKHKILLEMNNDEIENKIDTLCSFDSNRFSRMLEIASSSIASINTASFMTKGFKVLIQNNTISFYAIDSTKALKTQDSIDYNGETIEVLLSSESINLIKQFLKKEISKTIFIGFSKNTFFIEIKNNMLFIPIVSGNFPNVEQLFTLEDGKKIKIDNNTVLTKLALVASNIEASSNSKINEKIELKIIDDRLIIYNETSLGNSEEEVIIQNIDSIIKEIAMHYSQLNSSLGLFKSQHSDIYLFDKPKNLINIEIKKGEEKTNIVCFIMINE